MKHYLVLIISLFFVVILTCCNKKEIDYNVRSRWIYINETNHSISYKPDDCCNEFNISAFDTIIYNMSGDGPEEVTESYYYPPLNVHAVVIDSVKCDSTLALEIKETSSYISNKIGKRYYEFIFRFTDQNTSSAVDCN